jgi:phosphoketolase
LQDGAFVLQETPGDKMVVLAAIGDMTLLPVLEAAKQLAAQGIGSRIVSIISPRRLYRPTDVAARLSSESDTHFIDDATFDRLFSGDALIGITGGTSAMLEPVLLRSRAPRDVFAWQRGETTASAGQLMGLNGITAEAFVSRAIALLG